MTGEAFTLTVGPTGDGRKLAIISRGGHPRIRPDETCEVLTVEVVDGWGRRKIDAWYQDMIATRPWETRQ